MTLVYMQIWVHDIEVAPNFFCEVLLNYRTEEVIVFEVSQRKNQLQELKNFYKEHRRDYFVGFNSLTYDDVIIEELLKTNDTNWDVICNKILQLSNEIIEKEEVKYSRILRTVDLMRFWTLLIRKSKKVSLKGLMSLINHEKIQELPFKPNTILPVESLDMVIDYCINDVKGTYKLAKRLRRSINLRVDITKKYGFNAMSMDDVNMGLTILLKKYCQASGEDEQLVKEYRTRNSIHHFKDYILPYISFKNHKLQAMLDDFKTKIVTDNDVLEYEVLYEGNLYSLGLGGLHTKDKSCVVYSDEKKLLSIDATSYYPHLLFKNKWKPSHLLDIFIDIYEEMYYVREAAKQKKGDPEADSINAIYKLALNGLTGMLKNEYSWVYDTSCNLKITINGQLLMLMLIEALETNHIKVISANTDGVEIKVDSSQFELLNNICEEWTNLTQIPLEKEEYELIIREDVNSYLAIYKSGKVKQKGRLIYDPVLEMVHSNNMLVIPKAVLAYFKDKTSPETYIRNNTNIFDFCATPKVDKSYTILWNDIIQQNINRYYVSKSGAYLYKCKNGSSYNMLKGYAVQLYNDASQQQPLDINYSYYINRVNEIINTIQPKHLELFT